MNRKIWSEIDQNPKVSIELRKRDSKEKDLARREIGRGEMEEEGELLIGVLLNSLIAGNITLIK